jgi:hypothetical protein
MQRNDEKSKLKFVKIKFHLNENIEWHHMQLELNSKNLIEFKYLHWIKFKFKFKFNWVQLDSMEF